MNTCMNMQQGVQFHTMQQCDGASGIAGHDRKRTWTRKQMRMRTRIKKNAFNTLRSADSSTAIISSELHNLTKLSVSTLLLLLLRRTVMHSVVQ